MRFEQVWKKSNKLISNIHRWEWKWCCLLSSIVEDTHFHLCARKNVISSFMWAIMRENLQILYRGSLQANEIQDTVRCRNIEVVWCKSDVITYMLNVSVHFTCFQKVLFWLLRNPNYLFIWNWWFGPFSCWLWLEMRLPRTFCVCQTLAERFSK